MSFINSFRFSLIGSWRRLFCGLTLNQKAAINHHIQKKINIWSSIKIMISDTYYISFSYHLEKIKLKKTFSKINKKR